MRVESVGVESVGVESGGGTDVVEREEPYVAAGVAAASARVRFR